jgi:hypothetical protein
MDWNEAERIQYRHTCSVCGKLPQIYHDEQRYAEDGKPLKRGYIVRCQNPEHQGLTEAKSYTQMWRDGDPLPLTIANKIEDRERRRYG